jgi:two-component system NtrC family sensor kinase
MSIFHSLSFRVVAGLSILLLALFGMYSYFAIHFYTEQMMSYRLESANRLSDVINKSTHYSMLLNRKEDVYQTIMTIGKEPGVEGIRIYNKRGEIMFSTDQREEHSIVNMNAEACFACHDQAKPLEALPTNNRMRIYTSPKGYRILGLIEPIRNEPSCSDGGCHAHSPDRKVLGVLDVRMSLEQIDNSIAKARHTMITYSVALILIVAVVAALFLTITVLKPVKTLMKGVQQISSGNLDLPITVQSKDELGTLAHSFNDMTRLLKHEKEENRRWSETLQERIREKTGELKAVHSQILQIEKMASLGKLSATVAHELNNPLEGILTYAKLIAKRLKKDATTSTLQQQTLEDIDLIARETSRCGTIVKNLLLFSKKQVGEFALIPVKQIVEKAARLVHHHFTISNVQMQTSYSSDDISIMCDENQMQQALVALFVNAVEAMPEGGAILLNVNQTEPEDEITITLSDTGIGILQEDLLHIFEPFFTTKTGGKGVGLGLSVVYGIIERHGGRISVSSESGKGTTFTITIPPITTRPQQPDAQARTLTKDAV